MGVNGRPFPAEAATDVGTSDPTRPMRERPLTDEQFFASVRNQQATIRVLMLAMALFIGGALGWLAKMAHDALYLGAGQ